jgi:thiamine biosynthesis lipoprotein
LEQARRVCGCQYLSITPGDELVKTIRELEVNLSAVAKGFAVDEAARLLRGRGFTNLMVEIGGEVVASGLNHEGQKWRIGIQTPAPEAPPGEALEGVVRLSGRALATSGDYRRFYVDARQGRYSHILNPKTGRPVLHNLASVSVVADDCLTADGLATTLFVLGLPDGLRWIESRTNSAALFIVRESEGKFRRVLSSRFATMTAFEP